MFRNLIHAVDKIAGTAKSEAARWLLNHKILQPENIGEMTSLNIDSNRKHISASVLLNGEMDSISIEADYDMEFRGEGCFIKLKEIQCSKEWLGILARKFTAGQRYQVPEMVGKLNLL